MANDVTTLLHRWNDGDTDAREQLIPIVYDHLRQIARAYVSRESASHALQPTAVVHELFLRLIKQQDALWEDRAQFFRFAAHVMRHIIVDEARNRKSAKRGGGAAAVPLSPELAWVDATSEEVVDLDSALNELAVAFPQAVEALEYRVFLGCTAEETAEILGVSKPTVDRHLRLAKTWLYERLRPGQG